MQAAQHNRARKSLLLLSSIIGHEMQQHAAAACTCWHQSTAGSARAVSLKSHRCTTRAGRMTRYWQP